MKTDKSEKERQDFQYLTTQMETLLYEHPQNATTLSRDLADTQSLIQQVKNYVDVQMDELEKVSRQTRNAMEEEREKLIKERNSLPWE